MVATSHTEKSMMTCMYTNLLLLRHVFHSTVILDGYVHGLSWSVCNPTSGVADPSQNRRLSQPLKCYVITILNVFPGIYTMIESRLLPRTISDFIPVVNIYRKYLLKCQSMLMHYNFPIYPIKITLETLTIWVPW